MNSERKLLFMKKHRSLNVISGPLLFLVVLLVLAPIIEFKQAAAIATIFWMGLWWVLRPVNIAVTSLLPIPLNAIFGMVPMEGIISKYFSEIVVLLVGSDLISLVWEKTHLDNRQTLIKMCFFPHQAVILSAWCGKKHILISVWRLKAFADWEHRCASRFAFGCWLQRCCLSFCQTSSLL